MLISSILILITFILVMKIFYNISEKYCHKPVVKNKNRITYGIINSKGVHILNPILQ